MQWAVKRHSAVKAQEGGHHGYMQEQIQFMEMAGTPSVWMEKGKEKPPPKRQLRKAAKAKNHLNFNTTERKMQHVGNQN